MSTYCGRKPGRPSVASQKVRGRSGSGIPQDLRTWMNRSALIRLAQGIAQQQTVSSLRVVFSFSATRFHHPSRLLTLLIYAYASGLWQSCAIAEVAALDPNLVALCHGEAPTAELIRRFRNQNRRAILHALEQLLGRLWCHRFNRSVSMLQPMNRLEIFCDARSRLQCAEQWEERETTRFGLI